MENPLDIEIAYVTHTCCNPLCESAFVDKDVHEAQNIPPDYLYCPVCISKGFKKTKEQTRKDARHWKVRDNVPDLISKIPKNLSHLSEEILSKTLELLERDKIRSGQMTAKSIFKEVLTFYS